MSETLQQLFDALSTLPGLGPRSAKRVALYMLTNPEKSLIPLQHAIGKAAESLQICNECANLDENNPCTICQNENRDRSTLCVVESLADLWAIEHNTDYKGIYHILGGSLSALAGRDPEKLRIPKLISRVKEINVKEVIFSLNLTIEGQITARYISDHLPDNIRKTRPAHGIPAGGELEFMDRTTLSTAFTERSLFS